jgi:hypothetical protein
MGGPEVKYIVPLYADNKAHIYWYTILTGPFGADAYVSRCARHLVYEDWAVQDAKPERAVCRQCLVRNSPEQQTLG